MNAVATLKGPVGWTIAQWQAAYREEGATPETLLAAWAERGGPSDNAWIKRVDGAMLARQLDALHGLLEAAGGDLARLPLYGVPFAIKDNIDAAGWPTTAACPDFAYMP
ncbi:amidase family protein, partial [Achromobacter insolitus]